MTSKSNLFLAISAAVTVGLFVTGITATAFAESIVPFQGIYEGYDSDGDDFSGSFVDWGTYSVFQGVMETHGTYEFIEVPTDESGGHYVTNYTISDDQGNSLEFESTEISWIEYAQGKFGVAQSEWKVVGGEGKFEGATGNGLERTWFNLEDWSYKGTTSGSIRLS